MLFVIIVVGGIAVTLAGLRKRLVRIASITAAAIALMSCPASSSSPTQVPPEVYHMTGSGTWSTGVVMTATVTLTASPGTYNFQFKFKDSSGADVISGGALGTLPLTIN
jgi:hypothetical protein